MNYEQISKVNPKRYLQLHKEFEEAGLAIPEGVEVQPTEWAYQNGVVQYRKNRTFVKIRDGRNGGTILVSKGTNKQPDPYWAGFWKRK
jgi:hypothetical protein